MFRVSYALCPTQIASQYQVMMREAQKQKELENATFEIKGLKQDLVVVQRENDALRTELDKQV